MKIKATNFNLTRGDDCTLRLSLHYRNETGEVKPLDLSRFHTFDLHAKDEESEELVLALSSKSAIKIEASENGTLLLMFDHASTEQATWETAIYDLQAQTANGEVKTLARGRIRLVHDVTRGKRE